MFAMMTACHDNELGCITGKSNSNLEKWITPAGSPFEIKSIFGHRLDQVSLILQCILLAISSALNALYFRILKNRFT
jgi:hypothetical protein